MRFTDVFMPFMAQAVKKNLDVAKEAVGNYLQMFPDARISGLRNLPFKNPDDAHRFEEGLRNAGLPE